MRSFIPRWQLPVTAIREMKILNELSHPSMVRLLEIVTSVGEVRWAAQIQNVLALAHNSTVVSRLCVYTSICLRLPHVLSYSARRDRNSIIYRPPRTSLPCRGYCCRSVFIFSSNEQAMANYREPEYKPYNSLLVSSINTPTVCFCSRPTSHTQCRTPPPRRLENFV